jgi:hypothetical protein
LLSGSSRLDCKGACVIITTTDPVTGEQLHNLTAKPFIIEGRGRLAVKIYFESEETRLSYIHMYRDIKVSTEHNH